MAENGSSWASYIPIIGNVIDMFSNNSQMNKQIKAQKELQQSQNDFNLQMWNMNNDYNSPANQVSLYERAGLNPSFFLQGGAAGNASPVTASNAQAPSYTPTNFGQGFADMARMIYEEDLMKANIHKTEAEAGKNEAETKTEDQIREWKVDYQKALAGLTEDQRQKVSAETANLQVQSAYTNSLKELTDTQKQELDIIVQYLPMMKTAELAKISAEIKGILARASADSAEARRCQALLGLIAEQIKTEQKTQEKLDSDIGVNESVKGLNESNSKRIDTETEGQDIQNAINRETSGATVFGENVEGYAGSVTGVIGNISGIVSDFIGGTVAKATGKAALQNADTNARNAATNEYNARTNRYGTVHRVNQSHRNPSNKRKR